ncbi:MAG: type II toxin-antitoxin system VapC family toxin [Chloroflexi bacterium]|nr:type II toxin-antitoxin system VapC family toxin [Chloroflexota bacterium]
MKAPLVIDASAALHITLADDPTPGLDRYELLAPALFLSERTSALAAAAFRAAIPETAVLQAFDRVEALAVRIVDTDRVHRRAALELARSLGWANTYDAEYVILAKAMGSAILTTDERLRRGAAHLVEMLDPQALA